ncbi:polymer-forming cytoskeletal protein [Sulfurimonas aquatica]|uniref:Polymer-forming cytoskeletal protein n=1 Tax=Sulfurimonas aquatica TaxID=2672570 RepID=A0A975AYW1_9BACT|nr:polymer-forming cytoskeletal protein [Sulfurimonas aquatica]QSZ41131.1 polymer-forming cytoskeletal protein [Sulfurimonas aquatica]
MAIFNNSDNTSEGAPANSNTTIITAGSKIKGELDLSCNLYIDGELDGMIKSTKEINVGKNGRLKGNIKTEKLIVQGFVEGTVEATRVEIKAAGHVSGEITSTELIIESKGVFEGNSIVKSTQPAITV